MAGIQKRAAIIADSSTTNQGERLLLLVKRDGRSTLEIASAMGVDKSYLPKLYKMDKLPKKSMVRACQVFDVPESYFTHTGETLSPEIVRELEERMRKAEEESEMLRRLYKMALERIEKLEGELEEKEPKQD